MMMRMRIPQRIQAVRTPWFVAIGAAAAALGLLGWLLRGPRLPLQNLWAVETLPDDMPVVLLPFSQYEATFLIALLVTGSALAGLIARPVAGTRRRAALAALAGVLLVQVIAIAQTVAVVSSGLEDSNRSTLYLAAIGAIILLGLICGVGVFLLLALAPRAGATLGAGLAAIAAGWWLSGALSTVILFAPYDSPLLSVLRWVPAVLLGLALGWCGLATPGRVVAWVLDLALLWGIPAVATGVFYVLGSRVALGSEQAALVGDGLRVIAAAATSGATLPPVVAAAVIGAVVLLLRRLVAQRRRTA
jgi:hypothetical protein